MKKSKFNWPKYMANALFVLCTFGLSLNMASAQVFSGTSSPAAMITDDGYDGTMGSMTCDPITISGIPPGATIADISIDLQANHTWVGDLAIKLYAPNGELVGLMSRPGFAEVADDGTDCCGDSSDLEDTNTETWSDGGTTSAEDMGNTIAGDDVVCADDLLCDYSPAPDQIMGQLTFTALAATVTDGNGDWTLCIGDSAAGDTGELSSWSINITAAEIVPTMGEWGLIVLGLMLLIFSAVAITSRDKSLQSKITA